MEASDLARKAAEIANRDVGGKEDLGSNDSYRIRQYDLTVAIAPGQPYCAAAVSTWIKEAGAELDVKPVFKSSSGALRLLALNQGLIIEPEELTPEMLPCVGVKKRPGTGKGHAFLIVGMDESLNLQTIEPNSDGHGSGEGQGTYALNIRHASDLEGAIRIV